MRKFKRLPEPEFLSGKSETWGKDWEQRYTANKGATFHWHKLNGTPLNHMLLPHLKAQTQEHCSFCDHFPVSPPSNDTIDHFRPKTVFPRDAYKWDNLYYCCDFCQGRGAKFDADLLRPDADDYSFYKYFIWNFEQGTIEVNGQASPEDQKRAKLTLELYRLNIGHPRFRRLELRKRSKMPEDPIDDFAYRDFVEAPETEIVTVKP